MVSIESSRLTLEALRLQNGYARAIDTRDWDHFRTLFAADVIADYPQHHFEGMDDWLSFFVPFHDECIWTQHVMTTHVAGEDGQGVWASCYGFVQWIQSHSPDVVNRSAVLYRDRLCEQDDIWVIARRRLDIIMSHPAVPIAEGQTFPNSVLDFID